MRLGGAARPSRPVSFDARAEPITIDLAQTALVVVDMQRFFTDPDGLVAITGGDVSGSRAPIAPINALLPVLRDADVPIVWVNWGNRPDGANLPPTVQRVFTRAFDGRGIGDPLPNGSPILTKGSWSAEIDPALDVDDRDVFVDKFRHSGFWDSDLDSILRGLGVQSLLFAGVNTDQCVLHTLADASFIGYGCVLLEDCCGTNSPQFCVDATLHNVRDAFGFTATSADLVGAIRAAT